MKLTTSTSRALLLVALGTATAVAFAASAHFVRGPFASLNSSNGNVTVSWKEAGLGDTVNVGYVASANGIARYQCVNRGGNCPAASNKQDVAGPVTASGVFASGKNGTISGSLTFEPPAGTLDCPGGQVLKMVSASFTGIGLEDTTNSVYAGATPSSLGMSGPECPD
ncbi:MAG TPA: hypothetical protein VNS59_05420 [Lysobacter sp.]|nr:hypothetical protein [Lysobacter sp.]